MKNSKFICSVLDFAIRTNITDELFFGFTRTGKISVFVNVSDVFYWGCADLERLTKKTFKFLKQCYNETDELVFPYYYAAYLRKERPQDAFYKQIDKKWWNLIDSCGPLRNQDSLNPGIRNDV